MSISSLRKGVARDWCSDPLLAFLPHNLNHLSTRWIAAVGRLASACFGFVDNERTSIDLFALKKDLRTSGRTKFNSRCSPVWRNVKMACSTGKSFAARWGPKRCFTAPSWWIDHLGGPRMVTSFYLHHFLSAVGAFEEHRTTGWDTKLKQRIRKVF